MVAVALVVVAALAAAGTAAVVAAAEELLLVEAVAVVFAFAEVAEVGSVVTFQAAKVQTEETNPAKSQSGKAVEEGRWLLAGVLVPVLASRYSLALLASQV